jgi:hypothetical protein
MASIRRVPEVYPTIAAAMAEAAEGDTILLKPSATAYAIGPSYPRRVHIVGDTTDTVGNPCIVRPSGLNYGNNPWSPSGNGDVWWEGIKMLPASSNRIALSPLGGTSVWRFSKCYFARDTVEWHFSLQTYPAKVWFYQCRYEQRQGGGTNGWDSEFFDGYGGVVEAWNCHLDSSWSARWPAPEIVLDNSVYTATQGYGPAYGDWLAPQFMAQPYGIGGTIEDIGAGYGFENWEILLFRELAAGTNQLDRSYWQRTVAHPLTGAWAFEYLPRDRRYAVVINGPAQTLGHFWRWYDPALAD